MASRVKQKIRNSSQDIRSRSFLMGFRFISFLFFKVANIKKKIILSATPFMGEWWRDLWGELPTRKKQPTPNFFSELIRWIYLCLVVIVDALDFQGREVGTGPVLRGRGPGGLHSGAAVVEEYQENTLLKWEINETLFLKKHMTHFCWQFWWGLAVASVVFTNPEQLEFLKILKMTQ